MASVALRLQRSALPSASGPRRGVMTKVSYVEKYTTEQMSLAERVLSRVEAASNPREEQKRLGRPFLSHLLRMAAVAFATLGYFPQ